MTTLAKLLRRSDGASMSFPHTATACSLGSGARGGLPPRHFPDVKVFLRIPRVLSAAEGDFSPARGVRHGFGGRAPAPRHPPAAVEGGHGELHTKGAGGRMLQTEGGPRQDDLGRDTG